MGGVMIILFGVAGLAFGWFVYSRFIAEKIYQLDPDFQTPAHELSDGVDYVPTNKYVLWGHHFTSVAGAAPIVGPAIAVYWGWLPALLWVVFGTIFFAGVHDMGALWASTRNKGKSIGALSENVIGKRTRSLFLIVIFLLLLMVNAVFGVVIANGFVGTPGSVFPAWMAIAVALVIGQLLRRNYSLMLLTAAGVAILYFSIWAGTFIEISLPDSLFGLAPSANWIIILFIYAAIASMLPVWVLLQPRDFINGMQLIVGLILLYGAVLLTMPDMVAPAFNTQTAEGTPSIFPLLFVTIACGAISGFHGIVASGTSSKQLDKETDARFVGYLGAVGEGSLALITIVAVCTVAYAASPDQWHTLYAEFSDGGAPAFVAGGAALIGTSWPGISEGFAQVLLATMVALFAGTTMDSGVRLQRYIIQEWGDIYGIKLFKSGLAATIVAVVACLLLAFGAGGSSGAGGMIIWPLFGATNQILASLTLLVITVMLIKMGRPSFYTLIPMIFVLITSFLAGMLQLVSFYNEGNYLLVFLDFVVLVVSVLVMLEAASVVSKLKKDQAASESAS
ncbi:carbon starvation protein A [Pseudohongiella nitratireducens]|uniref:Carbon starvation protein A n=1 Tax=Pseudohongiella nitratireducens TaxID=1768907 RepID=A0A916QL48_9GAMM|nr:carbon starvation protein A [Pseudohongiella nitratireducens]GFZ77841.1 carbon starvation protein A [Pseudohongiella nitratireducens]